MKALGYVRVSTVEQAARGSSLEAQKSAIAAECEREGMALEVVGDTAPGGSMKRRPALEQALTRLDDGEAGALVVARLDRLARSTLDFAGIMERASRSGWRLVVLDIGLDLSTPYGEFAAAIWAAVAQVERRIISERQKDSIAERRRAGTYRAPQPQVAPETVKLIKAERRKGKSLRVIARRLDLWGIDSPRGGPWSHTTVVDVLRRAQHAGAPASPPAVQTLQDDH